MHRIGYQMIRVEALKSEKLKIGLKVKHVLDKKTDLSQKFGQHSNKNPFFGFKDMDMKTNGQYLEAFYSFVDTHIRIF